MTTNDKVRKELEAVREKIRSYDGGDRPQSPPARLLAEERRLSAALSAPPTDERVCHICGAGCPAPAVHAAADDVPAPPPEPMAPAMAPAKDAPPPEPKPEPCMLADCEGPDGQIPPHPYHEPEPKPDATRYGAVQIQCALGVPLGPVVPCEISVAPSPEAATRCQRHSVFCVGCESCARVQGAALRAATAELERVRANEAWWKRQRDDALAANERAKNGFAKERATLRAKLEEAERDRAGEYGMRVAAQKRADAAEARAKEAERERNAAHAVLAQQDVIFRDRTKGRFYASMRVERIGLLFDALDDAERRIGEAVAYCESEISPDGPAPVNPILVLDLLTPPAGTEGDHA